MSEFMDELQSVINRHSKENGSGTPDFILASFLADSLKAFEVGVNDRERWYGREQDEFGMPPRSTKHIKVEGDSKTVAFKVIAADFGTSVKTVGLLDHSTDEVAWMNDWLSKREYGNRPFSMMVTEFDGFGAPSVMPGAYIYLVQSGRVNRV